MLHNLELLLAGIQSMNDGKFINYQSILFLEKNCYISLRSTSSENLKYSIFNVNCLWFYHEPGFMVKPYTSDIRMTYKCIRVTYGWHRSTYEWHTDDIQVHTRDIRMTYQYIRVTYEWHTSTYEWHTDDMRVHTSGIQMTYEYIRVTYGWHTSTYEWHTNDIRVHTSDIRMTCEWHTDDTGLERKIKLSFLKLFDNSLSNHLICKRIPCMQWLFWVIYQN